MQQFLKHGTEELLDLCFEHMVWASNFKYSVFCDESLALTWIYPNSLPPTSHMPTESELSARESGRTVSEGLIARRFTQRSVQYDSRLTTKQCLMLWQREIDIFEDEALQCKSVEGRGRYRPTEQQWADSCTVIVQWDLVIEHCTRTDLSPEDFANLQSCILKTRDMDQQLLTIFRRWPSSFYIGMLPDIRDTIGSVQDE